ncbi:MAG: T9SS type A sorting domain-containing protein [Saprospiraceae bacterium]|jgi:hypothetical protein|nr:T9SS type A sorting domain-containing protein [Saprospiraceae bacterium]
MKNVLLFALCWLLPLSYSIAQKTLTPSAQKVSCELAAKTRSLFQMAGFKLTAGKVLENEKELTTLQLDSTITYYDYDDLLLDSFPQTRFVYTYLPQYDAVIATEYIYDIDQWSALSRTTRITDELEREVGILAELFDPTTQSWVPDSQLEIFPHGDSPELIDSVRVSGWSPEINDWVRVMTNWNVFDDQERITESFTFVPGFEPALLFKDVYEYDDNGDNTAIYSYLVDGDLLIPAGFLEYTYDNHYVTSVIYLALDEFEMPYPTERITYAYTEFWKESDVKSYVINATLNGWILTQRNQYGYDEEQRLIAHDQALYNDEGDEFTRTYYEYLEGEYLARESNLILSAGIPEYELLDRKYYYYSDGNVSGTPNQPLEVKALHMSPNPTFDVVQIQLESDARVQIFNMQGQLMQRFTLQSGYMTLDLNDLPAGVYHLQAQTAEGYYAGKLVKQ